MKHSSLKNHPHLRSLAQAGLVAGLILLTTLTAARAQTLRLQMESIIAEGWETWPSAWIENPQVYTPGAYGEPSKLSISSTLLTEPTVGPLWYGLSIGVAATVPPSPPGIYDVVATSSGTDWVNELPLENVLSTLDWLASLTPPACPTDLTVTRQLTVVGLTGITADRYHVADGDTVTFTAAMTPVNAFEFIYWDGWGPFCNQVGGGTYQKQMTRYNQPQTNGVVALTASCGTKTLSVGITAYQLTGLSVFANNPRSSDSIIKMKIRKPDMKINSLCIIYCVQ